MWVDPDPVVVYPLGYPGGFVDPSFEPPSAQGDYLEALLVAEDEYSPVLSQSHTPPWGESVDESYYVAEGELAEQYLIAPDLHAGASAELLHDVSDPYGNRHATPVWSNDDQYHGLGVAPGAPNTDQPIEYGRTQAIPEIPSAAHGWDAWTGRSPLARVARQFNDFPGYSAGVKRAMGDRPIEKFVQPLALQTQMYRDMLQVELKRRGIHEVIIAGSPSVPYSETVVQIDPSALVQEPALGPEGVLP